VIQYLEVLFQIQYKTSVKVNISIESTKYILQMTNILTAFFEYNCKFREAELWQFQIKINFYPILCMAPPLNLYLEPQLNNEIETSPENQRETQKNYLKNPLNNFCNEIN